MGGRRKHNRWQLEKYICVLRPKLERQTGGVISLQELGVPESSPPLTDNQLDLVDHPDNIQAGRALAPIFEDMILSNGEEHWLYEVLAIAGLRNPDPGAVGRWRAGKTKEDKQFSFLFEKALDHVTDELIKRYPKYEMRVAVSRTDEPVGSLTQAAARDREEARRALWARAHRERYQRLLDIEAEYPEADREAAKGMWIDRRGMSMSTIRDAIRFAEKHEWPDGREVEPELRWKEREESA